MRITLKQLADELGLDKSTVSLAMRNDQRIAAPTRERVQAHAAARG